MKTSEMRGQSAQNLNEHIIELRREQFSLRMQKSQGGEAKTHDFKRVRRDIARAQTVLAEQSKQGGSK